MVIDVNNALNGDEKAKLIFDTTVYHVAKEVGARAASLTGSLAYSELLVDELSRYIGFIASIHVDPGENEMDALCRGTLRYLTGEEGLREYS